MNTRSSAERARVRMAELYEDYYQTTDTLSDRRQRMEIARQRFNQVDQRMWQSIDRGEEFQERDRLIRRERRLERAEDEYDETSEKYLDIKYDMEQIQKQFPNETFKDNQGRPVYVTYPPGREPVGYVEEIARADWPVDTRMSHERIIRR